MTPYACVAMREPLTLSLDTNRWERQGNRVSHEAVLPTNVGWKGVGDSRVRVLRSLRQHLTREGSAVRSTAAHVAGPVGVPLPGCLWCGCHLCINRQS